MFPYTPAAPERDHRVRKGFDGINGGALLQPEGFVLELTLMFGLSYRITPNTIQYMYHA